MANNSILAEVAALQRDVDAGRLVESHGRLVARGEIACVEHLEGGGIRWPAMTTTQGADTMLDDYTKATFPLDVKRTDGGLVRLFGTMSGKVFGITYHAYTDCDGVLVESLGQAMEWNADGAFSLGQYPEMNLMIPPAKAATRIVELEAEAVTAQGRLDSMPDAPAEWRAIDEKRIARIATEIELLRS